MSHMYNRNGGGEVKALLGQEASQPSRPEWSGLGPRGGGKGTGAQSRMAEIGPEDKRHHVAECRQMGLRVMRHYAGNRACWWSAGIRRHLHGSCGKRTSRGSSLGVWGPVSAQQPALPG